MVLKKIKPYMMPLSMLLGGIFYKYVSHLSFITPFLIGTMLFLTYCNTPFKEIRFSKLHLVLLSIQILGSIGVYYLLYPISPIVAQGTMICIFAPTATSAPVITNMLGGNVASLTAYSLLSNMMVVILAPILFSLINEVNTISFGESVIDIFGRIFILVLLPLIAAFLLKKFIPKLHNNVKQRQDISFYLWSFALLITTGKIVLFITMQENANYLIESITVLMASIVCLSQFILGRALGKKTNNTIAGGQSLGQKNTILAIWMAQTYLNPISSIGPGSYVLWQNIVNSYQVWKKRSSL